VTHCRSMVLTFESPNLCVLVLKWSKRGKAPDKKDLLSFDSRFNLKKEDPLKVAANQFILSRNLVLCFFFFFPPLTLNNETK